MEKLQTLLWLSFLVVANIEVCPGGGSRLCRWSSKCRHKFTYCTTDFKSRTKKVKETFLILHFLDRSLTVYRLVGNRVDLCEEAIAEQYWAALSSLETFLILRNTALLGNFQIVDSHSAHSLLKPFSALAKYLTLYKNHHQPLQFV